MGEVNQLTPDNIQATTITDYLNAFEIEETLTGTLATATPPAFGDYYTGSLDLTFTKVRTLAPFCLGYVILGSGATSLLPYSDVALQSMAFTPNYAMTAFINFVVNTSKVTVNGATQFNSSATYSIVIYVLRNKNLKR